MSIQTSQSSKVVKLYEEAQSASSVDGLYGKAISSADLMKIVSAMVFELMQNLGRLIDKSSQDLQNQGNNSALIAKSTEDQIGALRDKLDAWNREQAQLAQAAKMTKVFTWIGVAIGAAVAGVLMGPAAFVVAAAIGSLGASGQLEEGSPIGDGIKSLSETLESKTGISASVWSFAIKLVIIVALSAAGGAASGIGVTEGAARTFVQKSMGIMLALQLTATTGAMFDLCLSIANAVDKDNSEEGKERKKFGAQIAAMIVNVVLMLASMKAMPSANSVNLPDRSAMLSAGLKVLQQMNLLGQTAGGVWSGAVNIKLGDVTLDLSLVRKIMAILAGMTETNDGQVKRTQSNLKTTMDEYDSINADLRNLNAANEQLARSMA